MFTWESISSSIHIEGLALPTQSRDNALPQAGMMGWRLSITVGSRELCAPSILADDAHVYVRKHSDVCRISVGSRGGGKRMHEIKRKGEGQV